MIAFLVAMAAGWLLAVLLTWLEALPWRNAEQAAFHWTERARRLQNVRLACTLNHWLIPTFLAVTAYCHLPDWPWLWVLLGGFVGVILAAHLIDRRIIPEFTFGVWLRYVMSSLAVQSSYFVWYVAAALLMPRQFSWMTAALTLALIAILVGYHSGANVRILRMVGLLGPLSARHQSFVDAVAAEAGVAVRASWELKVPVANALAFVVTRELAFTTKLLATMSDAQLRAVTLHELGHLMESRLMAAGRIAGSFGLLPFIFIRPLHATFGAAGFVFIGVASLVVWLLRTALYRAMEKRADRIAVAAVADPRVYAEALELIHHVNLIPVAFARSVGKLHPDLYDRMLAAGVTPGYPRPENPAGFAASSGVLIFATVFSFLIKVGTS